MADPEDTIPIVEEYRGVGIHDAQPRERIETIVKPEIDKIFELGGELERLDEIAGDITWAPEARLFAAAMCRAIFQSAADERRERPEIDLERLLAKVAGLSSRRWRSRTAYCSALDTPAAPGCPGAVRREPLPERLAGDSA